MCGVGSHPCRLVSISCRSTLDCHGRGREFESRRPRHNFSNLYGIGPIPARVQKGTKNAQRLLGPAPFVWLYIS